MTRTAAILLFALLLLAQGAVAADLSDDERTFARERIEKDCYANVTLDSVEFEGRKVVVSGTSKNVNAIANFMENIRWDPLFTMPDVEPIEKVAGSNPPVYLFRFHFEVKAESDEGKH